MAVITAMSVDNPEYKLVQRFLVMMDNLLAQTGKPADFVCLGRQEWELFIVFCDHFNFVIGESDVADYQGTPVYKMPLDSLIGVGVNGKI